MKAGTAFRTMHSTQTASQLTALWAQTSASGSPPVNGGEDLQSRQDHLAIRRANQSRGGGAGSVVLCTFPSVPDRPGDSSPDSSLGCRSISLEQHHQRISARE